MPTNKQIEAGCKHFNGLQHPKCNAGIVYKSLGFPLPCITNDQGEYSGTCALFEFQSEAEIEAEQQRTDEAATKWVNSLMSGVCPYCQTKIEQKEQVGRCVYARPCGCRLYQGRV